VGRDLQEERVYQMHRIHRYLCLLNQAPRTSLYLWFNGMASSALDISVWFSNERRAPSGPISQSWESMPQCRLPFVHWRQLHADFARFLWECKNAVVCLIRAPRFSVLWLLVIPGIDGQICCSRGLVELRCEGIDGSIGLDWIRSDRFRGGFACSLHCWSDQQWAATF
jgi:hypothetical protein